ncbi:MAG TPA: xanthine dehydrogenase molybdopterin binding subunit [Beijerinckiaceae bacterium]|jgi:xanthine dehydrogenase large subunit|nr:xanthine dehydrogenase molybdopterin binding subunit [Beijerinckiaceae bacterium]
MLPNEHMAPEASGERLSIVRKPSPHDSARLHVRGVAPYIDDILEPTGTLHVAPGLANVASGTITKIDLDAVRTAPGVIAVLTPADIPGKNDVAPAFGDDPLFAEKEIVFAGQVIFAVVARTRDEARRAAKLARVEITPSKPLLTIEDALAANAKVLPDYDFNRGDPAAAVKAAPLKLEGQLRIGGQEHFYLEGQAALAVPGEAGEILVHSSTQDPTEVQHVVARVLAMPDAFVTVETRRMGGGFGGKESQAAQTAVMAALAARVTGKPCKVRLDRDDDFAITGKRHDFRADWAIGFDARGQVSAYDVTLHARCGCSVDLSPGVCDRAMFHAGNCYWLPQVKILSTRLRTNTVSNTAFRGFGGPQGMLAIERAMDGIAHATGLDPLDVRKANLLRPGGDLTPYGQKAEDADVLVALLDKLEASSDYRRRKAAIAAFNATSPILKKGLALTPVQFGISFTLIAMNQAGALVHVYQDGSVHLNHGGTEMGQGLFTKVAQVVAEEFGIPLDWVRVTATNTAKVPNTSPTAASSGSDLNGMAAQIAAAAIKARMIAHAVEAYGVPENSIAFRDGVVYIGNATVPFPDFAKQCRQARVQLSHAGFYKTPKIEWDREARKGRPFLYYAYGAACSEVIIDTLTGEMKVTRVDVLHDVGNSLNPALDKGQIEGGFVQGMGWLTTEELVFNDKGILTTHAPSTYKIPVASDVPKDFRIDLLDHPNREVTIYRSKAVGEPPFMLAISVFSAILDALHSLAPGRQVPLDAPATPERILMAAEALTNTLAKRP